MPYEVRIPETIDIWYIAPRRPRMEGGDTSDTYMGESSDTAPTASPPRKRATTKDVKLPAAAVAAEVRAKRTATRMSNRRRPKRSVSRPAMSEPTTHPKRSELNAQPRPRSPRENARRMKGPAPVMMAMSKPNSSPPSAAVQARNVM